VDLGRTEQLKKEKMEKAAAAGQAEISDGTQDMPENISDSRSGA
jgi:hypothetical protein